MLVFYGVVYDGLCKDSLIWFGQDTDDGAWHGGYGVV